jgi:hypothetical protein
LLLKAADASARSGLDRRRAESQNSNIRFFEQGKMIGEDPRISLNRLVGSLIGVASLVLALLAWMAYVQR